MGEHFESQDAGERKENPVKAVCAWSGKSLQGRFLWSFQLPNRFELSIKFLR